MNPIYRTITGQIQCTLEGGQLFVRSWNHIEGTVGPWRQDNTTLEVAERLWITAGAESKYMSGCIASCLRKDSHSPWLSPYKSEELQIKINDLTEQYEK